MPAVPVRYLRLVELVLEWSEASGVPPWIVLRHVCEWTMAGAFPKGALVDDRGNQILPLSIFEASLASVHRGEAVFSTGTLLLGEERANERLRAVLVSAEDVKKFCETTQTIPPPSVLKGFRRIWSLSSCDWDLAPRSNPDAQAIADHLCAEDQAQSALNSMRSHLRKFRAALPMADSDSIDLTYMERQWAFYRTLVQPALERCNDQTLEQELQALENGWNEVVNEFGRLRPSATQQPVTDDRGRARLVLRMQTKTILFDGKEFQLSEQLMTLLRFLAGKSKDGFQWVNNREIAKHLWGESLPHVRRSIRDVVRSLRVSLGQAEDNAVGRDLVINRPRVGYGLSLLPEEIAIQE